MFNCSESTCFHVIERVMDFLLNIMPDIIKMPNTNEEKKETSNEFKKVPTLVMNN